MLKGKKILLAISGGIAAYKMPELVRRLKEQGAEVRVAMTKNASCFISPMTLQAVSGESVGLEVMDPATEASMGHIDFAKWPDLVLLAPATANTVAKLANGLADDLVSTLLLATPAPIAVAPAMNMLMYQAPATQVNLKKIADYGIQLWGPASGEQACGDVGPGRMLEPMQLLKLVQQHFQQAEPEQVLQGLKVTITAGPTREAIDPVRYISNHSSGKMGYAIAKAAKALGAEVSLISGPVDIAVPSGVSCTQVDSAEQMLAASLQQAANSDVFVACAAVADYRVAEVAEQKIKKSADEMQLTLVKNPDIVASIAALEAKPFTVGFAAETQNVEHYAQDKMQRKNLDMIAANNVATPGLGFGSERNALKLFWPGGEQSLPEDSKENLALALMQQVAQQLSNKK